jgi:hypothetical protein
MMFLSLRKTACLLILLGIGLLLVQVAPGQALDGPGIPVIDIIPHDTNPILPRGAEDEWDDGFTYGAQVVYHEGLFHMFYAGGGDFSIRASAVGYATSEDGLNWTKFDANPILELDSSQAAYGIRMAVPLVDGDTWVLYINPHERPGVNDQSMSILRATAPAPSGPWTLDAAPIMEVTGGRDWDNLLIAANSVFRLEDEYRLYYNAYGSFGAVGLATSPDGITWTRYDDPDTTGPQFSSSDPVFVGGPADTWDDGANIDPVAVLRTENGWEMFYTGWGSGWNNYFGGGATCEDVPAGTGFAFSEDGIDWTRAGDGPLLPCEDTVVPEASSVIVTEDGTYYVYYSIFTTYPTTSEIGVATGTVRYE